MDNETLMYAVYTLNKVGYEVTFGTKDSMARVWIKHDQIDSHHEFDSVQELVRFAKAL